MLSEKQNPSHMQLPRALPENRAGASTRQAETRRKNMPLATTTTQHSKNRPRTTRRQNHERLLCHPAKPLPTLMPPVVNIHAQAIGVNKQPNLPCRPPPTRGPSRGAIHIIRVGLAGALNAAPKRGQRKACQRRWKRALSGPRLLRVAGQIAGRRDPRGRPACMHTPADAHEHHDGHDRAHGAHNDRQF